MRFTTNLTLPVGKLSFVGNKYLSCLNRLGIRNIRDLLWHFPVRYEDYSKIVSIEEVSPGQKVNIQGEVVKISTQRLFRRKRMTIVDAVIKDLTGSIRAVWFNQPYIANSLIEGSQVSLAGKVTTGKRGVYLSSPIYEKLIGDNMSDATKDLRHTQGLIPVYPETEGLSSKYLRFLIKPLLKPLKSVKDPLPENVRRKYSFFSLGKALNAIHYPKNLGEAQKAKDRLAFDDLLLFQLKALLERRKINQLKSIKILFDQPLVQNFIEQLPFELTRDQKVAAWEILKDIQKPYPMNRLMEGDVGSGKTVVALIAALQTSHAGYQTVFMAPTEVLAAQHAQTLWDLTRKNKLRIALLTGSVAMVNREKMSKIELKKKVTAGEVNILIGTHAVIQKDVRFKNLALVVIDEQHRFGIEQRAALLHSRISGDEGSTYVPHLLSMTATPIPRTLALTIFGDLDISIIKEKPKNRQRIITQIISSRKQKETHAFIRKEVTAGRQVFVICPRIEVQDDESNTKETNQKDKKLTAPRQMKMNIIWQEVKAVRDEYERLSEEIFPDLKVAMLHGKMKSKEKREIMQEFKEGRYNILVSTSVVEVGVDIPNATIMMIENADRFGLAQLHQFRGRVGRDVHQSYCFLFTSGNPEANQRLKALVDCDDGFKLAEKDMTIRGPGEFFGIKQSGMPDLTMASLTNMDLIKKARFEARLILKNDHSLSNHPLLIQRLKEFQSMHHFE
jgi:ATP-dependent DNA helicase RecG